MLTVSQYQRGLAHYYGCYKGAIDGKAGPSTKKAVKKFQKLQGLTQDGKYGPKTNSALVSVVKRIQSIVGATKDGVCGPSTVSKIKAKQKAWGLAQDGICGPKFWAKANGSSSSSSSSAGHYTAHFKKSEFKCKCGGRYCNGYPAGDMNTKLLNILEKVRAHYGGRSVTIRSGQRCAKHNAQIGGKANSSHKKGKAADIYIPGICNTASGRRQVVSYAYSCGAKYAYANTKQMGTSVHINV